VESKLTAKIINKTAEVKREVWDCLLDGGSPFMRWDWLDSLEQTGCVSEKSGWIPHHIIIEKKGKPIAACPMYLKWHSMGEFVYDHEWAWFASKAGIKYYPKMLVGVRFPPSMSISASRMRWNLSGRSGLCRGSAFSSTGRTTVTSPLMTI
jgi:predicted N-acyltransferase